jgi:thiosulfate dehydrogenase
MVAGSVVLVAGLGFISSVLNKNGNKETVLKPDLSQIPSGKFGEEVKYGRELMLHTAKLIGPDGINGKYLGNKMNCTNCHQDAGTKGFSFNLMASHENYPQYRAREGNACRKDQQLH